MALLRARGAVWPGAIGVSGGGDSVALLVMLAEWAKGNGLAPPLVLTVDHRLRAKSADDTHAVFAFARSLSLDVQILRSANKSVRSDIEAWARETRYRLLADACRKHRLGAVYVGHNQDDQAETFLLRLARGSGVDGLSAMQGFSAYPLSEYGELKLIRPLLEFSRGELRAFLEQRGIVWRNDPMNEDTRFARARLRAAWPAIEAAGLSAARIAAAAAHLRRAREALEDATAEFLARYTQRSGNHTLIDGNVLSALPRELGLRVLAKILTDVAEAQYRPRFERLCALYEALHHDGFCRARTLHGCRLRRVTKKNALFGASTIAVEKEIARKLRKP